MKDCLSCEHFKSFREDFFGDMMEPDDQGFCLNGKSPYHFNEGAGIFVVCDYHTIKPKEE